MVALTEQDYPTIFFLSAKLISQRSNIGQKERNFIFSFNILYSLYVFDPIHLIQTAVDHPLPCHILFFAYGMNLIE